MGSLIVAALFYVGACAILRLWRLRAAGEDAPRRLRVVSHVAVVVITAIFLSSYVVRARTAPGYGIPVLAVTSAVWAHFKLGSWRAMPSGSRVYVDAQGDVFPRQGADKKPPFV